MATAGGSGARAASAAPARVVLRPLGNPLPLGFVGLAGATTVLAALQLGLVSQSEMFEVGLVIVAFAVPLQLVACVLAFLARDAAAGASMGILAGSWLSIGLVSLFSSPGATSEALGVLLLLGAAVLIPAAGAALGKAVVAAVLATTCVRFLLTGFYELFAEPGLDGAFFLLLDEPEVYGLPPDPVDTTRHLGEMWRAAAGAGLALAAGVAAASAGGRR